MADEELRIPVDVRFNHLTIMQDHIVKDFNYYKLILRSHEVDIAFLSVGVVFLMVSNYYLYTRIRKIEGKIDD
jgi:hypothetical protein